ncbi:MAG: hypothetical protein LUO96_05310, partial [Methanomicrobiales archaeon]|nr:hypothetical protein [Methanomicrobiales archaeon]
PVLKDPRPEFPPQICTPDDDHQYERDEDCPPVPFHVLFLLLNVRQLNWWNIKTYLVSLPPLLLPPHYSAYLRR